MTRPFTDEELAKLRTDTAAFLLALTPLDAIRRLLATLAAREAAHRQEIAEIEVAATDSERATAELIASLRQEIDARDARIADLEERLRSSRRALDDMRGYKPPEPVNG